MNYRHGYHAGNFADVLKHVALCELLRLLTAKDKKLFVLDTHAGVGGYDLSGSLAARTREAEAGIGRLMAMPRAGRPAAVARYLAAVAAGGGRGPLAGVAARGGAGGVRGFLGGGGALRPKWGGGGGGAPVAGPAGGGGGGPAAGPRVGRRGAAPAGGVAPKAGFPRQ